MADATWQWRDYLQPTWARPVADVQALVSATTLVGQLPDSFTWAGTPGLVDDVQGWLNSPADRIGWILPGREMDAQNAKRFDSRQGLFAGRRPLRGAQMAPVPEASTLAMRCAGLLLLLLLLRRRGARG